MSASSASSNYGCLPPPRKAPGDGRGRKATQRALKLFAAFPALPGNLEDAIISLRERADLFHAPRPRQFRSCPRLASLSNECTRVAFDRKRAVTHRVPATSRCFNSLKHALGEKNNPLESDAPATAGTS